MTALDDEAARLLGIERALPRAFAEIATDLQGWADVLRAVAEGQRTDIYLRGDLRDASFSNPDTPSTE